MGNKVFSSRYPSPRSNSGDLAAAAAMDRWTGVVQAPLSRGGPPFRVAALFILSPAKTLAAPRANAILFTGDRVRGTGEPAIERLSDAAYLFAGPLAVYWELVPSVDAVGDPKRYDPTGFPAAAGVAKCQHLHTLRIQNMISRGSLKDSANIQHPTASLSSYSPRTNILRFSKGVVVVNQLVTELSCWASKSTKNSVAVSQPSPSLLTNNLLVAASTSDVLSSISEFHYVDVSLNCAGAYITDHAVMKETANYVLHTSKNLCFVLHGTPRQWSDPNRSWIRKEKDTMLQLLQDEAKKCEG